MSPSRRPLDDLLLYRLSRLLAVGGSMVIRLCEGRFGITRREWRLLATLASRGELSSSQLAEHAQLDRARTSKAVGSMVAKGLLSRTHPAGDRRQVLLGLTERGRALYDQLFPLVTRINAELMAALDADTAARLDDALRRLQAQAERMAGEAVLPKADRGRRGAGG
jgi:DNA-binding MarR family transcriptional regulator